ncbi:unnamed protein product [Protopolystoma xenopodis]|uniref:Uncharacterized protein n=1 Tax=Protopolystoma xenopodis TaxID=117903 RepID=A0A448WBN7_9PLAT|nr:unnamed protein product [Protopolystoma xenopodis]
MRIEHAGSSISFEGDTNLTTSTSDVATSSHLDNDPEASSMVSGSLAGAGDRPPDDLMESIEVGGPAVRTGPVTSGVLKFKAVGLTGSGVGPAKMPTGRLTANRHILPPSTRGSSQGPVVRRQQGRRLPTSRPDCNVLEASSPLANSKLANMMRSALVNVTSGETVVAGGSNVDGDPAKLQSYRSRPPADNLSPGFVGGRRRHRIPATEDDFEEEDSDEARLLSRATPLSLLSGQAGARQSLLLTVNEENELVLMPVSPIPDPVTTSSTSRTPLNVLPELSHSQALLDSPRVLKPSNFGANSFSAGLNRSQAQPVSQPRIRNLRRQPVNRLRSRLTNAQDVPANLDVSNSSSTSCHDVELPRVVPMHVTCLSSGEEEDSDTDFDRIHAINALLAEEDEDGETVGETDQSLNYEHRLSAETRTSSGAINFADGLLGVEESEILVDEASCYQDGMTETLPLYEDALRLLSSNRS